MLIKGALAAQMSGSLAGLTASHNRGGQYLRSRTIPVNPGSTQQTIVRSAMNLLSTAWVDTLTPAQRAAWDTYAANVPVVNRVGDTINLTGLNMYVRSNVPRIQAVIGAVDNAPTIFNLGTYTDPTYVVAEATDDVAVTFDALDDWANEDDASMLIYASRPQSPSTEFFKGPYRLAGTIDGDAVTAPTSPTTIALPFPIAAGQRVFFNARVSRADGRLSASFRGQDDS